jgi:hypothetical protein
MPLPRNSQSLPAVSWSGVWRITNISGKGSKVFSLLVSFTAPYAASKKQPIFSGCFLEWCLANNIQNVVSLLPLYVVYDSTLFHLFFYKGLECLSS